MKRFGLTHLLPLGAIVVAIGCGGDDSTGPATETFTATMNGASERPTPRTTPATGTATFTLRRDTLSWTITLSNISNVTASHIHVGGPEEAGGIVLGLTPPVSNTSISGLIARSAFAPPAAPNQALTFDALIDLMRSGGAYVNVHTNNTANDPTNNAGPGDFPAGEIRGQISKAS